MAPGNAVRKGVILFAMFLLGLFILLYYGHKALLIFILCIVILELLSYFLIRNLRKKFQWLITPEDESPELSREGLKKFIDHGYDTELGWVRKPNTEKEEIGKEGTTKYYIDRIGSRKNPGHEKLPKKMSFYGDSFIFARQVNDGQTCQWHLSELTKTNVLNFAVGNYGLDQALLRLKREYPKNKTEVVIMGVVPSTIVRVLCMWKHYNEFGNTFGFKPRFILKKGKLSLIKNVIDSEEKFFAYKRFLPKIRKYDYFYRTKFKEEMIKFPYFVSILSNPARNIPLIFMVILHSWVKKEKKLEVYPAPMRIIMDINLKLRYRLYKKNNDAVNLMMKLIEEFAAYGKRNKFVPVFLFMPQKDDLLLIREKGCFYDDFIKKIEKKIHIIDLMNILINRNDLDRIYSDDNQYGGHYSSYGNKLIAGIIYEELKKRKLFN